MEPPDDIEFDFFDEEPATVERSQSGRARASRVRLPQRRPREGRPQGRASHPVATLGIATVLGTFIVLVFGLLIASCTGESKHSLYSNYMNRVTTIANQSTTDGRSVVSALTTPGKSVSSIVTTLDNIASAEQQNVLAAQRLSPPGGSGRSTRT